MEPRLEVLPGRRLGLVPQKVRTDDGCRRHESDADQGNGVVRRIQEGSAGEAGAFTAARPPLHADQHRSERPVLLAVD